MTTLAEEFLNDIGQGPYQPKKETPAQSVKQDPKKEDEEDKVKIKKEDDEEEEKYTDQMEIDKKSEREPFGAVLETEYMKSLLEVYRGILCIYWGNWMIF